MAEFNAELLRIVAMGPKPSKTLLKAVAEFTEPDGTNKVLDAYRKMNGRWSKGQKKIQKQSRELLYAAVMLRAAASLEQSGQEGSGVSQDKRLAESTLCIRFTSKAADQEENKRSSDKKSGHEDSNPNLPSVKYRAAGGAATDNKILFSSFANDEDGYAARVLLAFSVRGLACPPDPK